jgi:hypothetical protein
MNADEADRRGFFYDLSAKISQISVHQRLIRFLKHFDLLLTHYLLIFSNLRVLCILCGEKLLPA